MQEINELRFVLVPKVMDDAQFWAIYFALNRSSLPPECYDLSLQVDEQPVALDPPSRPRQPVKLVCSQAFPAKLPSIDHTSPQRLLFEAVATARVLCSALRSWPKFRRTFQRGFGVRSFVFLSIRHVQAQRCNIYGTSGLQQQYQSEALLRCYLYVCAHVGRGQWMVRRLRWLVLQAATPEALKKEFKDFKMKPAARESDDREATSEASGGGGTTSGWLRNLLNGFDMEVPTGERLEQDTVRKPHPPYSHTSIDTVAFPFALTDDLERPSTTLHLFTFGILPLDHGSFNKCCL